MPSSKWHNIDMSLSIQTVAERRKKSRLRQVWTLNAGRGDHGIKARHHLISESSTMLGMKSRQTSDGTSDFGSEEHTEPLRHVLDS